MYLDFYSLSQAPFHVTPDPEVLFLSPSHKAALGALVYGIAAHQGLIAIFGAAGVGKTTLLRAYLTHVNRQELTTIFVSHVALGFDDLLRCILRDLGSTVTTDDPRAMVRQLQQLLVEEARHSRHVVLIIDGAQAMPVETLAQLRCLADLEDTTGNPLQIVLVGQPELHQVLAHAALRHLEQSIAIRATVLPLTRQESLAYIHHRLAHAAKEQTSIFTTAALRRMVRYAQGLPSAINSLCTNVLIAGFAAQQKPITAALVQGVIADVQGRRRTPAWHRALASSAALALLGGLLWLVPWQGRHDTPGMAPHVTPGQDARTAQEAAETVVPVIPSRAPEGETNRGAYDAPSPVPVTQPSEGTGAAPAQQAPTDTQALQEPGTRPETARRTPAEQFNTPALAHGLTSSARTDKPTAPTARRAQGARRTETKPSPHAAAERHVPSVVVSPRWSLPVLPGPAWPFFEIHDPRAPVNDAPS